MRVEIIDDTHQRFNGVTYRKNKRGWYQTPYSTIHRDVWTFHNGAIPAGKEIHHIDGDKANNQIENLQCVTRAEHIRLHHPHKVYECVCKFCGKTFTAKTERKRCDECLTEMKRRSELKKAAAQIPKPPKPPRTRICVVCGKEFKLKPTQSMNHGKKTCSKECSRKLRFILDDRICPICGNSFHPKHAKQRYCSPRCGQLAKGGAQAERVLSHCEFCGKEIWHLPSQHPRFCSRDCLNNFMSFSRRKAST